MSLSSSDGRVRINQFTDVRGSTVIRGAFVRSPRISPANKARSVDFVRVTTALRLRSDADDTETFARSLRPSLRFLAQQRRTPDSSARAPGRHCPSLRASGRIDGVARDQEVTGMRERSLPLAGVLPEVRWGGGDAASDLEYQISFASNCSIVRRSNQTGVDTRQVVIFCSLGDRVTNLLA